VETSPGARTKKGDSKMSPRDSPPTCAGSQIKTKCLPSLWETRPARAIVRRRSWRRPSGSISSSRGSVGRAPVFAGTRGRRASWARVRVSGEKSEPPKGSKAWMKSDFLEEEKSVEGRIQDGPTVRSNSGKKDHRFR
jgi:hypothetical protein